MLAAMLNVGAASGPRRKSGVGEKSLQEFLNENSPNVLTSAELTQVGHLESGSGNLSNKVQKFLDWDGVRDDYVVSVAGMFFVFDCIFFLNFRMSKSEPLVRSFLVLLAAYQCVFSFFQ